MKGHLGNIEEHGDIKKPRVYISPILKRIVLHPFRCCGINAFEKIGKKLSGIIDYARTKN